MAVDNRLTAEQFGVLAPGDPVTIEFVRDDRRPKRVAGIVIWLLGPPIVVSRSNDRGGKYVHEFSRRSGMRIGSGQQAELVAADAPVGQSTSAEARRQAVRVDAAYSEWSRDRSDLDRLRQLQAAIEDALLESSDSVQL